MRFALCLVVLLTAGCGADARPRQAAGWSPPAAVQRLADPVRPGLAGGVVASAPQRYACPPSFSPARRGVAARVGAGGTLAPRPSPPPRTAALVAGGGGLAALTVTERGRSGYACGAPVELTIADAPRADAPFGARRVVSRGTRVSEATLARGADGAVAAAWIEEDAAGDDAIEDPHEQRLRLAVVRGGRVVRRTVTRLAPDPDGFATLTGLALASEPGGGWLVAYAKRRTVYAARVSDRVVTQAVGRTSDTTDLALGVARTGRAVVVWGAQDGGEERDRPYVVRAARRERPGEPFAGAQVVDPGLRPVDTFQEAAGGPLVAFAADGTATIAWTRSREAPDQPAQVATAAPGRRFGRAATIARVAELGGLAVRADGAALLAWRGRRGRDRTGPVLAALRAPRADAFGPAETLVPAGATTVAAAGYDEVPVVVWGARRVEVSTETTDIRVQVRG